MLFSRYLCPMIKITLPDGSVREYEAGTSSMDIAKSISEGLARNVLAAKVNGEISEIFHVQLIRMLRLQLLTWNDTGGKAAFWHSSAHLMAEALESLYPGVKFGIGPPVENGYYYDVHLSSRSLSPENIPKIEEKMLELARQKDGYKKKKCQQSRCH